MGCVVLLALPDLSLIFPIKTWITVHCTRLSGTLSYVGMGIYSNKKSLSFLGPISLKLILPAGRRGTKKCSQYHPKIGKILQKKAFFPQNHYPLLRISSNKDPCMLDFFNRTCCHVFSEDGVTNSPPT